MLTRPLTMILMALTLACLFAANAVATDTIHGKIESAGAGRISVTDNLGTLVGSWTFTLYEVNPHNGHVGSADDSITITFD